MARLFSCGFELGSAAAGMELPLANNFFGGATVNNTGAGYSAHGGSYSMRIDAPASGAAQGCSYVFSPVNLDYIVVRVFIGPGTDGVAVNAKSTVFALLSFGLTPLLWVAFDAAGNVYFESEDETLLTLPGGAFSGEIWQSFEITLVRVAPGSDIVAFRSVGPNDGDSPAFIFSGKSISTGAAVVACGVNLRGDLSTTGRFYFDDLGVNDLSGTDGQSSWLGPGRGVVLTPNADGDMGQAGTQGTDWDTYPTAGGTAFQQVDETPTPDDDTSCLLFLTGSSGPTDPPVLDFDLASALSVIPAHARITLVQVGFRVRNVQGDNPAYAIARFKSGSGGTVLESQPQRILIGAANAHWTHGQAVPRTYTLTVYKDPSVPLAPLTPQLLDGAQVGMRMTLRGVGTVNG
jgi:hypothetical protein